MKRMIPYAARFVALTALVALILASGVACSFGDDGERSGTGDPDRGQSDGTTTTSRTTVVEQTLEETTASFEDAAGDPDVSLRLEGAPGTRFSGLCSVGDDRSVLSGQVPKRFVFQLSGQRLECRIQKQDDQPGSLKVTLLNGDSTRSVQQTNARNGTIQVSFGG